MLRPLLIPASPIHFVVRGIQLYAVIMLHIVLQKSFSFVWADRFSHPFRATPFGAATYTFAFLAGLPSRYFHLQSGSPAMKINHCWAHFQEHVQIPWLKFYMIKVRKIKLQFTGLKSTHYLCENSWRWLRRIINPVRWSGPAFPVSAPVSICATRL